MNLIHCALNCKYQKDGYCGLESPKSVNLTSSDCPYFKSTDNGNRLIEIPDTYKLNSRRNNIKLL